MSVKKNFEIRSWHIFAFITVLILYFYIFNVPPKTNGEDLLFWGYMHIFLHGTSLALYFLKNNRKSSYPFIAYFSFFQLIGFGIPVFVISKTKFLFSFLTIESLEYSFYAYLILYGAYWFFSRFLFRHIRPFQAVKTISLQRIHNVLFFFLMMIIIDYVKLIPALGQLTIIIKNVYIGLSLMLIFQHKLSAWGKIAIVSIVIIEIVSRAVSGLIAEVAYLLLFIVIVMNICSIKLTYLLPIMIPFMLFYTAFSKIKSTYREKVWFGKKAFTLSEKVNLIYDLSHKSSLGTKKSDSQGNNNFFHRYSYPSSIFARVLQRTPSIVPYWEGETYLSLFTKFIPRALWPDKPKETLGHDFGVRYGILAKSDKVTSINTPILVEMFINFGFQGLYIGCGLFGILLLFIDRYFCSNAISIENKIINSSITFSLIIIESNFSLTFGNLFLFCIILHFIFRAAK